MIFSQFLNRSQNSFLSNSFYLYLSHFADYLLALILLPIIAKNVGAVEFGKIGLAQTYGIFILLLMEFGSPLIATRKIALIKDDLEVLKKFIGKILTFKILIIPITCLITLFANEFIPIFKLNPNFIIIVTVGSIFQGISPVWYFQGIEKMKIIALSKFIFRLASFVTIIFFVKNPSDSWIVLLSFSVSSIFISLLLYLQMIKQTGKIYLVSPIEVKSILFESVNSFLISIVPVIHQNISIIILSFFVSPIQLGIYYGANKIYRAFNSLYSPISQAFFPMISSLFYHNRINSKIVIKKYIRLMMAVGFSFFIINFYFSEIIVQILLGTKFIEAHTLLKIFSLVLPLTAISNALGRQWLMAINKDFFYLSTLIISSLVSIIFFIFFIRKIGAAALPFSLIIFELSVLIIINIFFIKNDNS